MFLQRPESINFKQGSRHNGQVLSSAEERDTQVIALSRLSSLRVYLILRARLHEGGGPQIGEVTRLGGVKNNPPLYMQSYNPAIQGYTFSRLLNGR